MKKIIISKICGVIFTLTLSPFFVSPLASAQSTDEDLTPDVGVGNYYFKEGVIDEPTYKKIQNLKEEIRQQNTKIAGVIVLKSKDPTNYEKCKLEHTKREEKNGNYRIMPVPDIPKNPSTGVSPTGNSSTNTKTGTNAATSTATQPGSSYYDNDKCFYAGTSDNFKFAENAYYKLGCNLSDLQKTFTQSDITAMAGFYANHPDETFNTACPAEIKSEITVNTGLKPADIEKAKKKIGANLEQCKILYRNRICASAVTEKYITERKELQKKLNEIENPELFQCEYGPDGKINNPLCVQLTEKLGTTRVIGAKTGLGLIKAYMALIYRFGAIMVGIVAVLMIIVQGLKIAVGGPESIEDAKKKIMASLMGLAILFLAGAILYIINPNFFTFV